MPEINNAFYDDLGDTWFEGDDHPIALLRAESRIKVRYTRDTLDILGIMPGTRVLDLGCGAGLVALPLAEHGYDVTGVDLAEGALHAARERAGPGLALQYVAGDAYDIPFADGSFDAVLMLDLLEHVERPERVLKEASRVVRPGGAVVFHTFNKTPLAWLLAVHGFKFVTPNGPPNVHVYKLFIPPDDLIHEARGVGLGIREIRGVRPKFNGAFWRSVRQRRVDPGFSFTLAEKPWVGYLGYGVRDR